MQGLVISSEAIVSALGLSLAMIVWLVRLEGRINYTEKMTGELSNEIHDLRIKHEELANKIVDKLSNVEKSLAKIEGRLSINNSNPK